MCPACPLVRYDVQFSAENVLENFLLSRSLARLLLDENFRNYVYRRNIITSCCWVYVVSRRNSKLKLIFRVYFREKYQFSVGTAASMAAIIDIVSFYCFFSVRSSVFTRELHTQMSHVTILNKAALNRSRASLVYFKKSFKNELNDNSESGFKCGSS